MAIQAEVVMRKVRPYGLLVVLCVLAFWPMFQNGFVMDDQYFIVNNRSLRELWPLSRFFPPQASVATGLPQRPVMAFSLALDYALFNLNPFGYHLTNLLLHLLCVLGVSWLAFWLSRSRGVAFLAGALFALHPGHAEGVVAFLGRSDLLATLFVLFGFYGYDRYLRAEGGRKALYYAASLASFVLACFSKETGLTLLGLLVVYGVFGGDSKIQNLKSKIVQLVPFLLIGLFYWIQRAKTLGGQAVGSAWWGGSPYKNFLMAFEVYARYLRLMFFPLSLSPLHTVSVPGGLWDGRVLLGLALLLGSLGVTVWTLRRHFGTGFLVSWYLIGLIPVANFIPVPGAQIMAERWLYMPSVGACILGGWGAWVIYRRSSGLVSKGWTGFVVLILVLFGTRTFLWCYPWRTKESISRAMVATAPQHPLGYFSLGCTFADQGKLNEAIAEYREALRLKPDYAEAHNNLGNTLDDQGKIEEAVAEYRAALRLNPDYADAHNNLGNRLDELGKTGEAVAEYCEALRLNPDLADAHNNLGVALEHQGKLNEAIAQFREAVHLNPDYLEALANLAFTLDSLGRRKEAREFWLRAEKLEKSPEWMERIKHRLAVPD